MKIIGKVNHKELDRKLLKGRLRAEKLGDALNDIENLIQSSVEQNFVEEGRPTPWKKLKSATIRGRTKRGTWPGQILTESSQLRSSVNTRVQGNTIFVGSNKKYAHAHQFGSPKKNIPKRPFLLFQKEDIKEAREILEEHLTNLK